MWLKHWVLTGFFLKVSCASRVNGRVKEQEQIRWKSHGLRAKVSCGSIRLRLFPGCLPVSDWSTSLVSRSGRGDRIGRYGNTSDDHNFCDMDYRGYDQEEEEPDPDASYGCDEQPADARDFRDPLGRLQQGDERKDTVGEVKGAPWPPCSQSHLDSPPHLPHAVENRSRWEPCPGPQDQVRGKGFFTDNAAPPPGSMDGTWGLGNTHSERVEFNTARQVEEERFSCEPVKRRVSRHFCLLNVLVLLCTWVAVCWQ